MQFHLKRISKFEMICLRETVEVAGTNTAPWIFSQGQKSGSELQGIWQKIKKDMRLKKDYGEQATSRTRIMFRKLVFCRLLTIDLTVLAAIHKRSACSRWIAPVLEGQKVLVIIIRDLYLLFGL